MNNLPEGKLEHRFPPSWVASQYDRWPFYLEHFKGACGGNKAVDFLAQDPKATLWLVELKDYRVHSRTKQIAVVDEVASKVRDSLAGVVAAAKWPSHHAHTKSAQLYLSAKRLRVVLHYEQSRTSSKLFPRVHDLSTLQQKLKQLVKVVDAHPLVVDLASAGSLPWEVASIAEARA
jgi:hypothetical protein